MIIPPCTIYYKSTQAGRYTAHRRCTTSHAEYPLVKQKVCVMYDPNWRNNWMASWARLRQINAQSGNRGQSSGIEVERFVSGLEQGRITSSRANFGPQISMRSELVVRIMACMLP